MYIARAPMRITLGGGGTDLPSYYERFGGHLLTAAIDKYVYVMVNPRFSPDYHLCYMQTEVAQSYEEIKHTRLREILRMYAVPRGVDVFCAADLPAKSGMGSSGSFTVAAVAALRAYRGMDGGPETVATDACFVEMVLLNEPCGKQDQYIAALGGVQELTLNQRGAVTHREVRLPVKTLSDLQSSTLLFWTGIQRSASEVLGKQQTKIASDEDTVARMHRIKELGEETLAGLEAGDADAFGRALHEHWMLKRGVHDGMSESSIDEAYGIALAHGAMGGKLVGAGGGGFLLIYCPGAQAKVIQSLEHLGLKHMPFQFTNQGVNVTEV